MLHKNTVTSLEKYLERYPDENLQQLLEDTRENERIVTRENEEGHFTASGLVLCEDKLLLIFHKKLQKYLQPGGHLEDDNTLLDAALREVKEETGIDATPHSSQEEVPFYIDIQKIPANEKKNESEHLHFDCMFLFEAKNKNVTLQECEVEGYDWVSLEYPFKDAGLQNAAERIKKALRT